MGHHFDRMVLSQEQRRSARQKDNKSPDKTTQSGYIFLHLQPAFRLRMCDVVITVADTAVRSDRGTEEQAPTQHGAASMQKGPVSSTVANARSRLMKQKMQNSQASSLIP